MEQSGPGNSDHDYIILAAPPEAAEANTLADALRAMGWTVMVTADVAPYASAARACVALVTPQTINGPALQSALSSHPRNLIPVLTAPLPLPYGPWAVAPIFMGESPQQAAGAIANIVLGLTAAPPFAAPMTTPFAPPFAQTQPAMGYPPAPVPPRARSRKSLWIGLGIALAVIVLLCAGGVAVVLTRNLLPVSAPSGVARSTATAALAVTPTATVPLGFVVYTNSSKTYQIIIPQDWSGDDSNGVTTIIGSIGASVYVQIAGRDTPISGADTAVQESAYFHSVSTSNGGLGAYTIVEKATPVTLAGETWTKETADVSVKGETLRAAILIANHNGGAYLIAYSTARSYFSKVDVEDFQPMLQSFEFLS